MSLETHLYDLTFDRPYQDYVLIPLAESNSTLAETVSQTNVFEKGVRRSIVSTPTNTELR